jgi:hypothetical protein
MPRPIWVAGAGQAHICWTEISGRVKTNFITALALAEIKASKQSSVSPASNRSCILNHERQFATTNAIELRAVDSGRKCGDISQAVIGWLSSYESDVLLKVISKWSGT